MAEEIKTGKMDDILKIINRNHETFNYEVFIPSLQKHVMFRELTTAQQKRIIKAIIDSEAFNTEFILTFKQIITENCADSSVNVDKLTIYDKLFIALKMRAMSVGDKLNVILTSEKGAKQSKEITLSKILELLPTTEFTNKSFSDDQKKITIECGLPTIDEEYRLESELRRNINDQDKSIKNMRELIGNIYTNEISKYLKKVSIVNGDSTVEVSTLDMSFANRIALLESLPAKVTRELVGYISSINTELEKVVLIKEVIDNEPFEYRLKLDASFFSPS